LTCTRLCSAVHAAFILLLLFFAVALAEPAFGQYDTGTVLGTVRDGSGAVIPGSHVLLRNVDKDTHTDRISNATGEFEFPSVLPGNYTLTSALTGFETVTTAPFNVTVSARQRVDLTLTVGHADQTITVTGAAALLETDSSDRGQVIAAREIVNLPLNGRDPADLALLVPGVRKSVIENETGTSREASYNINGLRSSWNNFILDGLDNNNYGVDNQGFSNQAIQVSPDALNEFRVQTDNYSAEYGRAGGGIINASVRSGTNAIHGAAWDFLRNTALNAQGPFIAPGGVPTLIQNQFGAAVGGPILRDKLFVFLDYEGLRRISRNFSSVVVPTVAADSGIFRDPTGAAITVTNPLTNTTYKSAIPTSAFNSLSSVVVPKLPAPNATLQVTTGPYAGMTSQIQGNYNSFPRGTLQDDKGDIRFDYYRGANQSFFGRYSQRLRSVLDPGVLPSPIDGKSNGNTLQANRQMAVGYTRVLSSASTVDVRFGVTWTDGNRQALSLGGPNLLTQAGIPNAPTDPSVAGGLNTQLLSGYAQFGRSASSGTDISPFVLNPKINYTLLHGNHSLKFGYEFLGISTLISNFHPQFGTDNYKSGFSQGSAKAPVNTAGVADPTYKNAWILADFLFGARSSYELSNTNSVGYQQQGHFAYAQDDWRALPNLTLNLGLRYEVVTPPEETNNRLSNFDPATSPVTGALVLSQTGTIASSALTQVNPLNFAPRLGFSLSATPRTVIRGAYGISYVQFNRVAGANELAGNGPFSVDTLVNQYTPYGKTTIQTPASKNALCTSLNQAIGSCFLSTQAGYPNGVLSPALFSPLNATVTYVPSKTPTTYVQSYQLSLQRELAPNIFFDVAYVGNTATHELILADYNQATPNASTATCSASVVTGCATLQARRPIANFAAIGDAFNEGHSNYNSLQTKIEKRFSRGLYFINSFTWSRGFDLAAGHLEASSNDSEYVNIRNISQSYGPSNYDQPINETFSAVYDLPYGRGRRFGSTANRAVDEALGGWQVTTITQATSGLPTNISYAENTTSADVSDLVIYRPNAVAGQALLAPASARVKTSGSLNGYFNPAATAIPIPGQPFGNLARNPVRAPRYVDVDLALHKRFALIRENQALEFRAEAFNVLNHVNYQAPDAITTDAAYGSITSAYPARELQLALKLIF
jgi:hypothetical protein